MALVMRLFRRNLHRLFNDTQLVQYLFILFGLFHLSLGLYEDQVGKIERIENYVGQIKFADFDTVSTDKKIIVATEDNVIAALDLESGKILWRHDLERGYAGKIRALGGISSGDLISVSGWVTATVLVLNLTTGHIINEWKFTEQNPKEIKNVKWHIKDGTLHHILPINNSGIEVISYDCPSGKKLKTQIVPASFVSSKEKCVLAGLYIACLEGTEKFSVISMINVFDVDYPFEDSITTNEIFGARAEGPFHLEIVRGDETLLAISADGDSRKRVLIINETPVVIPKDMDQDTSLYLTIANNEKILFQTSYKENVTSIKAINLLKYEEIEKLSTKIIHNSIVIKNIIASICPKINEAVTCWHFISTEDDRIGFIKKNKLIWSSKIETVEIEEESPSSGDKWLDHIKQYLIPIVKASWNFLGQSCSIGTNPANITLTVYAVDQFIGWSSANTMFSAPIYYNNLMKYYGKLSREDENKDCLITLLIEMTELNIVNCTTAQEIIDRLHREFNIIKLIIKFLKIGKYVGDVYHSYTELLADEMHL